MPEDISISLVGPDQRLALSAANRAEAALAAVPGAAAAVVNPALQQAVDIVSEAAVAAAAIATPAGLAALASARAAKIADTTRSSTTTLAIDSDLQVLVPANVMMGFRAVVPYAAGATGGLKWRHSGPAGLVALNLKRKALAPGAASESGVAVDTAYSTADISVTGGAGAGVLEFAGTLHNGATAGNFGISWAQNASDATATTLKAGSYIEYFLLPTTVTSGMSATAAIAQMGKLTSTGTSGLNPGGNYAAPSTGSYVDTVATGTECDAYLYNGTYKINVDGVASTVAIR